MTVAVPDLPGSVLSHQTYRFETNPVDSADRLDSSDRLEDQDHFGAGSWVSAVPFRAHLRYLMAATGLPWRVLAQLAGASPWEVQRLLQVRDGRPVRKIRLPLARRLYALTPASIAAARQTTVRVDQAVITIEALQDAGWTISELSSRLRLSGRLLRAIVEGRRPLCSRLVEVRIMAAAEALAEVQAQVGASDGAGGPTIRQDVALRPAA